jgi:hypothetical protein
MKIVVRQATDDDAKLIAGLTRAAWAGKVAVTSSGHRETAVLVSQHLRDGGGFILLDALGGGNRSMGNPAHGCIAVAPTAPIYPNT